MKKIGIVVVTYNRLSYLKDTVKSLRQQTIQDFDIVIVNNGSKDGTKEWLNNQEDIICIHQDNLGGAGGFCTGLKYVAENGYAFCWLMDDDVICDNYALEELLTSYSVCPKMGFACSLVKGENNEPMNVPNINLMPSKNGYSDAYLYLKHSMVKVESATFVSVMVPTNIIKEIGLPIQDFFLWGDDIEYTSRISKLYASYLVGKSCITHRRKNAVSLTIRNEMNINRIRNFKYAFRNSIYILKKYKGTLSILRFITNLLSEIPALAIDFQLLKIKIILSGIIEGFLFNPPISFPKNRKPA